MFDFCERKREIHYEEVEIVLDGVTIQIPYDTGMKLIGKFVCMSWELAVMTYYIKGMFLDISSLISHRKTRQPSRNFVIAPHLFWFIVTGTVSSSFDQLRPVFAMHSPISYCSILKNILYLQGWYSLFSLLLEAGDSEFCCIFRNSIFRGLCWWITIAENTMNL